MPALHLLVSHSLLPEFILPDVTFFPFRSPSFFGIYPWDTARGLFFIIRRCIFFFFCFDAAFSRYYASTGSPPARMASTSSTSLSVAVAICSAVKPFLFILFTIAASPPASPTVIPLSNALSSFLLLNYTYNSLPFPDFLL